MQASIELFGENCKVDFSKPIDISIPIGSKEKWVKAWYVNEPTFKPVEGDGFVGAVALGGSVNFRDVTFNPHGHGTHTECVGHITKEIHSVNQKVKQFFFAAQLVSISPEIVGGDSVITLSQVRQIRLNRFTKALIVRTLPNQPEKLKNNYSSTNPPYIAQDAMQFLVDFGIEQFLIDMPSVDKEIDGGALASHHTFWNTKGNIRFNCTITELIFVPNFVFDGRYLLNLQFAPLENDASPSRPVLFEIQ